MSNTVFNNNIRNIKYNMDYIGTIIVYKSIAVSNLYDHCLQYYSLSGTFKP